MKGIHILGISLSTIILIIVALAVGKKFGSNIPLIQNI
jgi:hypothetical protein